MRQRTEKRLSMRKEPTEIEPFSMNELMSLGKAFLDHQKAQLKLQENVESQKLKLQAKFDERNFEISKNIITNEFKKFKAYAGLLAIVIVSLLGISTSLIFLKDDTKTALLILTHMGAVIAGLLAGLGIKSQKKNQQIDVQQQ